MKINQFSFFKNATIKKQLYSVYAAAVIIPVSVIGVFLIINSTKLLTNYYRDLLGSDNLRVKTTLFEITTQIYNISEEIAFDSSVTSILENERASMAEITSEISEVSIIDNYINNYAEIDDITIYSSNTNISGYKQFMKPTKEVRDSDWYKKALNQSSVFWVPIESIDKYQNHYWNLYLVRKIPLINSESTAVLVIKVSDNYFRTRLDSQEYLTLLSVDDDKVFYSSNRDLYGTDQVVEIDQDIPYYTYTGDIDYDHQRYFVDLSTLHLYQSESRIYISTMNGQAYKNLTHITTICLLIILLAILVPGLIIIFYTNFFTSRVLSLRHNMHQASQEDYEIQDVVVGNDEISQAFRDLEIMVQRIKEKDAKIYEARINETELENQQQIMEFKMLASQINPHFLYNALETIRMKAFTAGDKEVANAIKLLGKSMRYVLENTGTSYTGFLNELQHIETYIAIQKLRFGNKFNFEQDIASDIDLSEYMILPLLLQPIVENALLHGLEDKEEGGLITLSIYRNRRNICIEIIDNGCGMDEEELNQLMENINIQNLERSRSIGLYNINQRIKLCYGQAYGIKITSQKGKGTSLCITLPEDKLMANKIGKK